MAGGVAIESATPLQFAGYRRTYFPIGVGGRCRTFPTAKMHEAIIRVRVPWAHGRFPAELLL